MKRSWIKLYVDLLDDVKLGPLPVWLRWRFIELLLVAAESDQSGILPSVTQMAWRLRVSESDLLKSLRSLSESGVICEQGERWKVTNFEKRQASLTEAERASQYRARQRQSAAAVTKSDAAAVTDSSSPSPSRGGESAERGGVASASEGLAAEREAYEAVPPPPDYAERLARMLADLRGEAGEP